MEQPAQQPPESKAYRDFSLILLLVNLLMSGIFTARIFLTRSTFSDTFGDFSSTPSIITYIALSSWFAWILPVLAALSVAKEFVTTNRRATLIWNGVHMAVIFLIWQLYIEGTLGPLMRLMNKLSG